MVGEGGITRFATIVRSSYPPYLRKKAYRVLMHNEIIPFSSDLYIG